MKTPEEILLKFGYDETYLGDDMTAIMNCMEEYASQFRREVTDEEIHAESLKRYPHVYNAKTNITNGDDRYVFESACKWLRSKMKGE